MQMRILGVALALATTTASAESRIERPDDYHAVGNRAHQGIPSHEISRVNGRRWAVWYASPMPDEDSNSYLVLATSDGPNAPWREVGVVDPDRDGPVRAFDPEMWIAPDGKLRLIWTERAVTPFLAVGKPFELSLARNDRLMMLELSAEDEPAVPSVDARQIGRGVMMCKPIVLDDGTWLWPSAHWGDAPSACFYESTDRGETFSLRSGVTLPEENRQFDEHAAVQLRNGDLLAFIRTIKGTGCMESVSHDRGRTWAEPQSARIVHTPSRLFLRKLRSGNLLLVKHGPLDKNVGRTDLTAYLSEDDGATWKGGLLIDARKDAAYPDGDQAPDGTIYLVHDHDRLGAQEVLISAFTEADVLADRLVTDTSFLRRVVTSDPPLTLGTCSRQTETTKGEKE